MAREAVVTKPTTGSVSNGQGQRESLEASQADRLPTVAPAAR
ncbi:hypothetical protein DFR24_0592 [Panacagrimonas perspica]|uniref:Uncharacterized protein n=1 Tax=Panacagrimonas perspica TaxID=381431 RepID=A0A4R7PC79_9GAMM|nr:hypothetical protein DFR24_0592 [Panacagrimonas perspica]